MVLRVTWKRAKAFTVAADYHPAKLTDSAGLVASLVTKKKTGFHATGTGVVRIIAHAHDLESWKQEVRRLISAEVPPERVVWNPVISQNLLFEEEGQIPNAPLKAFSVPSEFMALAATVIYHRSDARFHLLYACLWRLTHGEKHLLRIHSDPLVHELYRMQKSVRRDVHKTKAFVRFRKVMEEDGGEPFGEHYIAWHVTDHVSLPLSAPFFARRFAVMRWTILTPDASAHWDGEKLHYGAGAKAEDAPTEDAAEELWKTFYRAIFNPARIKIKAMKKEMPVRFWPTMPETALIPALLAEADQRVAGMLAHQEGYGLSVADFMPEVRDIPSLREAAAGCEGCPLFADATQTVFGEGPTDAALMLVGEQPGDEEDKAGHAFVGPAGKVLDRAMARVSIHRADIYITNAVKHFKFDWQEDRRHHRSPTLKEITGCRPWLEAEIAAVKPKVIGCLGLSATRSLVSPNVKLQDVLGQVMERGGVAYIPTYHPSAILRADNDNKQALYEALCEHLAMMKGFL